MFRIRPVCWFSCAVFLAAKGALAQSAGRSAQPIIEYTIAFAGSHPQAITPGTDGGMWFTDPGTNSIGRIEVTNPATLHTITEYPIPTPNSGPLGIVQAADGTLWFTESNANKIGRIAPGGVIEEYPIPTPDSFPNGITTFALDRYLFFTDYGIWFTESNANQIGYIDPTGVVTEYKIPTPASHPVGITWVADNAAWFTEYNGNNIGRIAPDGTITEYPIPTPNAGALGIGNTYGNVTVAEAKANKIGYIVVQFLPVPGIASFTETPLIAANADPVGATFGDGACVTLAAANQLSCANTSFADVVQYAVPTASSNPQGIALPPPLSSSGLWFVENATGKIANLPYSPYILSFAGTTPLPAGQVGQPYSGQIIGLEDAGATLQWSSSDPGLTVTASGALLPAGYNLIGTISGTPTFSGPQQIVATLTDGIGVTVRSTFTIQIAAASCTYSLSNSGEIFPAVGGVGNFAITTQPGCPWSVATPPNYWSFAETQSGVGSGPVNYQVSPNLTAAARAASFSIQGLSFAIFQEAGVSFSTFSGSTLPQFTAGAGWRTTFTFFNQGANSIPLTASFYDDNGNLEAVPVTTPGNPTPVVETWVEQTLAPKQVTTFDAADLPNSSFGEGSVQVAAVANGNNYGNYITPDGFAVLHYDPTNQLAAVPAGGSRMVIPFDNTGGVETGVILQISGYPVYPVQLFDETGAKLGSGNQSISLGALGRQWIPLATAFPETANKRGVVAFGSCGYVDIGINCSSPFTLAIRATAQGALTTLLPGTGTSIPHIISGAGWQTTFVLSNMSVFTGGNALQAASAQLNFFDDNGNPLALLSTFPQTGTRATASSPSQTIPLNGTWIVETASLLTDPLVTGSAQVAGGLTGFAILRYNPTGQETVVPLSSLTNPKAVLAFDNTAGSASYAGVSNVTLQAQPVPVVIRDERGNQIGSDTITIPPNGHTSFAIETKYPATANIRGTIEFDQQVPPGGALSPSIGVMGILATPAGTFATLPVMP